MLSKHNKEHRHQLQMVTVDDLVRKVEASKEIETNVAYRWFLGYGLTEKIPHFSTFGKNYVRRFADTDLFEKIFYHILQQAMDHGLVDAETLFIDSTPVKANDNKKKSIKLSVTNNSI